ncbi:hypothetical protein TWF281_007527 [Arthrobotrys megalospora]
MSIFGAITTFAASSLTTVLLDSSKSQNARAHEQQQPQTNNHRRPKQSVALPQKEAAEAAVPVPRIIELPSSPYQSKRTTSTTTSKPRQSRITTRQAIMQPAGLPQNSIWATMSYPIPRGPCLQKSSLISACSCQRFMVHPLKATTSFDCDGCGHHASFHRMKSHEEEVENAAKFRETLLSVEAAVGGGDNNNELRGSSRGRPVGLLQGRVEIEEEEEEDDETVDGDDAFLEPGRKRRVVAAGPGKKAVVPRAVSAKAGKRKRAGEQVVIE